MLQPPMPHIPFPLALNQYETFRRTIVLQQENGTPVDLTGFEVSGTIRRRYSDLEPTARFTCTKTGNPGEVELLLPLDQTALLINGNNLRATYVYDFVLCRTADDERMRLFGGPLTVSPGVTR